MGVTVLLTTSELQGHYNNAKEGAGSYKFAGT